MRSLFILVSVMFGAASGALAGFLVFLVVASLMISLRAAPKARVIGHVAFRVLSTAMGLAIPLLTLAGAAGAARVAWTSPIPGVGRILVMVIVAFAVLGAYLFAGLVASTSRRPCYKDSEGSLIIEWQSCDVRGRRLVAYERISRERQRRTGDVTLTAPGQRVAGAGNVLVVSLDDPLPAAEYGFGILLETVDTDALNVFYDPRLPLISRTDVVDGVELAIRAEQWVFDRDFRMSDPPPPEPPARQRGS